jgi:hypothetical protein
MISIKSDFKKIGAYNFDNLNSESKVDRLKRKQKSLAYLVASSIRAQYNISYIANTDIGDARWLKIEIRM